MSVQIRCPVCHAEYEQERSVLGTEVQCVCGEVFVAAAVPRRVQASAPTSPRKRSWLGTLAGLFAAGVFGFLAVIVGFLMTSDRADDFVDQVEEVAESVSDLPGLESGQFDYCYLLLRPETQRGLELNGYQQTVVAWKSQHLKYIITTWEVDGLSTSPHMQNIAEQTARDRNDVTKKRKSLREVSTILRQALTESQQSRFEQRLKSMRLSHVSTSVRGGSFFVTFDTDAPDQKDTSYEPLLNDETPLLLISASDVLQAIRHEDRTFAGLGFKRLKVRPLYFAPGAERDELVETLFSIVADETSPQFRRHTSLDALIQLAPRSQAQRFVPFLESSEKYVVIQTIRFLCEHAPAHVIEFVISNAENRTRYNWALEAIEKYGHRAAGILAAIDIRTNGANRKVLQRILRPFGSSIQLGEESAETAAARATQPAPLANDDDGLLKQYLLRPEIIGTDPGSPLPHDLNTVGGLTAALLSAHFNNQRKAISHYAANRDKYDFTRLPENSKHELADEVARRLLVRLGGQHREPYSEILFQVATSRQVPLFQAMIRFHSDRRAHYGVWGLTRYAPKIAAREIIRHEDEAFTVRHLLEWVYKARTNAIETHELALELAVRNDTKSAIQSSLANPR